MYRSCSKQVLQKNETPATRIQKSVDDDLAVNSYSQASKVTWSGVIRLDKQIMMLTTQITPAGITKLN